MVEEAQADFQKRLLLGRDFHNWTEGPGLVHRNLRDKDTRLMNKLFLLYLFLRPHGNY